jgi:hypothetical protein
VSLVLRLNGPFLRILQKIPVGFLVCLAGTLLFAVYSVRRGQDSNWDLQHYHDYAGYALLHWRYGTDIAAADVQTFFNPAPYVVPYFLRHHLSLRAAAFAMGAMHSWIVWVVWGLTRTLLPQAALGWRVLAVVTAVTGGLTLSEVGTSFGDLLLATPLLGALLLILQADRDGAARPGLRYGAAGVLAGIVTGLKLTNGVFALGLVAAILARPSRALFGRVVNFGAGGVVGLLIGTGWWSLYLWQRFGNPTFPLLNAYFRSPDAIAWNFVDPTYLPHSIWDAVSVPLHWALGKPVGSEVAFRDARVALAFLLIAGAGVALAIGRLERLDRDVRWALIRSAVFFTVSFALWSALFRIARYAIPLEIFAGLMVVALAVALLPMARFAVIPLSLATLLWTVPGEWGHRPWRTAFNGPHFPESLSRPAVFVLSEPRLSYLASYAPAASVFYGPLPALMPPGGHFVAAMTDKIRNPGPGGAWVVTHGRPPTADEQAMLAGIGVARSADCVTVDTLGWDGITACRLAPLP